ncbi:hypothetical protein [Amycolatopsis minnesotensis]
MTKTTRDPNRALWEARARGEHGSAWEELGTEPDGVAVEVVAA